MSNAIGLIGGSGFYSFDKTARQIQQDTPYSDDPIILYASEHKHPVYFLPRHGAQHAVPPHRVNYRANLWALKTLGVKTVLAANVVGGIVKDMAPGVLAVPDQIIDYTWGRAHTYFEAFSDDRFEEMTEAESHVDFTYPYDESLRQRLLHSARVLGSPIHDGGTYGATQGPRLESAAEIKRMAQDGCTLVGMTGMPEAGLARELGIAYASLCLVANWAAGITSDVIKFSEIASTLGQGVGGIHNIFNHVIENFDD